MRQNRAHRIQFGDATKVWSIKIARQSSVCPSDTRANGLVEVQETGNQRDVEIDTRRREDESMSLGPVPFYSRQRCRLDHLPDALFGKKNGVFPNLVSGSAFQDCTKKCGLQHIIRHAAELGHRNFVWKSHTVAKSQRVSFQNIYQKGQKRIAARQRAIKIENGDRLKGS